MQSSGIPRSEDSARNDSWITFETVYSVQGEEDYNLVNEKLGLAWFENTTLAELEREISYITITEAKEQFVRQWCMQNQKNADLSQGIRIWLEVVKSDIDFVITLRALRQISSLLKNVPIESRVQLVYDLRVPGMTSLDSPKQEWIRFYLNLSEALVETKYGEAFTQVGELLTQVLEEPLDLDIKTFCLAAINSTLCRCFPEQAEIRKKVEKEFHEAFYPLLNNSADQYEILYETIGAFVQFDPETALVMAYELNTRTRREQAMVHILRVSLLRRGNEDITEYLKEIIEPLGVRDKVGVIVKILNELRVKDVQLGLENLEYLIDLCSSLEDFSSRALALANLAILMFPLSPSRAMELANRATDAWNNEEDLRKSLSVGYRIVRIVAPIDKDKAKGLYQQVKDKCLLPGAALATGNLGADFLNNVILAIRAISGMSTDLINISIKRIERYIARVPASAHKCVLYAYLASSLYRTDADGEADRVVRVHIIPKLQKVTSNAIRRNLILTCLPVVYRFDEKESEDLCVQLTDNQRDLAWHVTIIWSLSHCFLSDLPEISNTKLKVQADRPKIAKVIALAKKLKQDYIICAAIETITNVIEHSFRANRLNSTQALELLQELDNLVQNALPDTHNIKHDGYLVITQAEIHRVRSMIFNLLIKTRSNRGLKKGDIKRQWETLIDMATKISNTSDRIFVLVAIAKAMKDYHKDSDYVAKLLTRAHAEITDIPALLDRLDRLHMISEAWHVAGNKSMAEFAIEQALDLLRQYEGKSRDQMLRTIVQTAYTIGDEQLASEVVSHFDNPRPIEGMLTVPERTLRIAELRKQPDKISQLLMITNLLHEHEIIMQSSVDRLLEDLVVGQGKIDHPRTLNSWLLHSRDCHSEVIMSVSNWVVENWTRNKRVNHFRVFKEAIELDIRLAEAAFNVGRDASFGSIEDSFAGLSSKYVVFEVGEADRAQEWLCQWISENAQKYLKICDPYFGTSELKYLSCVPDGSIVLIVTTTRNMAQSDPESIRLQWQGVSERAIPFVQFIIVPPEFDGRFHDRVIITEAGGLDIGGSLNGLGKSRQKIAVLSIDESKEVDTKYLKDMLDSTTWLMNNGVNPIVFTVGQMPKNPLNK